MDFGAAVGFDGSFGPDPEAERKRYGSGFFKQLGRPPSEDAAERGLINGSSGNKGSAKVAKSSDDCFSTSAPRAMAAAVLLPQTSSSNSLFSDAQQRLSSAGVNGGNMPGMVLRGGRGPFTPSQWMELEHQALIYKCINANIPVPSNLLIPVRKALESIGICYASGLLRSNSRWGTLQLGFSNRTDPEPGRCRRTDGKKWRCSRDAMADQKYCEHHMNRGRHRSRKPVEGLHSGHPVSGGPTTTTTATATFAATTTFSAAASKGLPVRSVVPGSGASENSFNRFQSALSVSADSSLNRLFMNKEDASEKIQKPSSGFCMTSPSMDLKSTTTPFLTDDSSHRSSSLLNSCQILGTPKDLADPKAEPNHLICQFKNDWSYGMKVQSSECIHLSISTPMASNQNKVNVSPLRSTYELYQPQMNLGIGGGMVYDEQVQTQTVNSIPVSWETSLGGPLGEVLHSASNNCSSTDSKNSSVLNLMTEGWESNFSSALGLSPIGVLQKNAYSSVSNSSAGSSPRAEEIRSKLLEEAARLGEL